jgi:septal ring factor EnvC (AmiA/AmiB activator)
MPTAIDRITETEHNQRQHEQHLAKLNARIEHLEQRVSRVEDELGIGQNIAADDHDMPVARSDRPRFRDD